MSEETSRTPEQIEADLARTRLELTTTVNELSERLDPRRQVEALKAEANATLDDVTARAKTFAEQVKNGDPKALGVAGAAVAAVGLFITLSIVRRR